MTSFSNWNNESRLLLFLLKLHFCIRFGDRFVSFIRSFDSDFTVALETFSCAYTHSQLESNFIRHIQCMVIVLLTCVLCAMWLRFIFVNCAINGLNGDPMLCVRGNLVSYIATQIHTYNGSKTCFFFSLIFVIFNAFQRYTFVQPVSGITMTIVRSISVSEMNI